MLGQADFSFMGELAACCAVEAVEQVRLGGLGADQLDSYIGQAISGFLAAQGPAIADKLAALVEPAAKKAADAVRPTVEALVKEYAPIAFAIIGGILGLSVLLGIYVAKKTYRRSA